MLISLETDLQWRLHSLTRMLLRASDIFTRQLTISDSTFRKSLSMSGYTVSGHPMYVVLSFFMSYIGLSESATFLYHTFRATSNIALGYKARNRLTIFLELSQLSLLPDPVKLDRSKHRICAAISMYLDCHSICPSECHLLNLVGANQRSRAELDSIFSRFGTVIHRVILATVDNASRRRGFVVMSNHAEAKDAMDNISQTNIRYVAAIATHLHPLLDHILCRGSIVDVSWAVIQRSQGVHFFLGAHRLTDCLHPGFLDGGDRTVTLEGQVDPAPPPSADTSTTPAFQTSGALSNRSKFSPISGARSRHASILVRNIPALLFSQDSDLEPLFCPFGDVKDIRKQGVSSTRSHTDTISVIVTYSSVAGAREAKAGLEGQHYGDGPLVVEYLPPSDCNTETGWKYGCDHISRSSLNPCASPFVFDTPSAASAPPTCPISGTFPDYFSKPTSSTPHNRFSLSEPVSRGYRSLPASGLPSRSNSAASWPVSVARQSFYA
jgi:hypothetical protein